MNRYEEKLAARKARFEELATKNQGESARVYQRARGLSSVIPFGQPILVGHHSERGDRRYRARIHDTYGKAFALSDKAEHYERKAASVGTGGISSDDPDAIDKLRAELDGLKRSQDQMKAANKAIRSHATEAAQIGALCQIGFTCEDAASLVKKDFPGRIGFPSYTLSNNSANMRRIAKRIEELEARWAQTDKIEEAEGFTYREDVEENRVMFCFPGKPDEKTRAILKSNGFKWSPTRGAWVRQLNGAGRYAGEVVRKALNELKSSQQA